MVSTNARSRSNIMAALLVLGIAALSIPICLLALQDWMFGLAAAYVVAFLTLAWVRPDVALMLIIGSTPLMNDLSGGAQGGKFSIAEVNLVLTLPVFFLHLLVQKRLPRIGPISLPVFAYLGVCCLASATTWRPGSAPISFFQMVVFLIIAVWAFSSFVPDLRKLKRCYYGLLVTCTFIACAVLTVGSGYVLGLHKNASGPTCAIGVIVGLELWFAEQDPRRRRLLALALMVVTPGLIVTLSRGAWLGTICGVFLLVALRRQYKLLARMALVLIPIIALCWNLLPQESREYATDFNRSRGNIAARYTDLDIAKDFYHKHPIFGSGVGIRKEYDATNIVWFTLAETGILGLITFGLIHVAFFGMIWVTQKQLDRADPLYSLLALGAALILYKLAHGMVDHYWQRGPAFAAWAAAGMATGVYYRVRQRAQTGTALEPAPSSPVH